MSGWSAHSILRYVTVIVVVIAAWWGGYGAFGHRMITALYHAPTSWLGDRLMSGRAHTPLATYLRRADEMTLLITLRAFALVLFLPLLAGVRKRPMAGAYLLLAVVVTVVTLFVSLEVHPALASTLRLDSVDYYAYKNIFVPDPNLVYRVKPLLHTRIAESGDPQPYVGGLDTSTDLSDWATDDEGFRNAHAAPRCDVVLIGDGMINTGRTLADTFGARLADHLDGWCVANLGIAGHGPFQYLQTLKTYGTKKHPRFTILAFNEGNDLQDIGKYIAWKSGSPASFTGGYEVGIANPLRRFTTAASETWMYLRRQTWKSAAATVFPAIHSESSTHSLAGNLASIRLPSGAVFPMVFIDREATKSPREIEQSGDWHRLEDLISAFKTICDQNGSIPAILFIPEAAHIYAQYSTDDSGVDWRDVRDSQVAAKMNLETAVTDLSRELGLRFISLSERFENAARTGDVLYDSFSVHLTPRATEIAAQYVSEMLRSDPAARSISAKPQDSSSDVALSAQR